MVYQDFRKCTHAVKIDGQSQMITSLQYACVASPRRSKYPPHDLTVFACGQHHMALGGTWTENPSRQRFRLRDDVPLTSVSKWRDVRFKNSRSVYTQPPLRDACLTSGKLLLRTLTKYSCHSAAGFETCIGVQVSKLLTDCRHK